MKKLIAAACILTLLLCLSIDANAKKTYKFNINETVGETILCKKHKDHNNYKIIRVTAVDKNTEKAIAKGMMAAVADALFRGIQGSSDPYTLEVIPRMDPILADGLEAYSNNTAFFDQFFKNGDFNNYIRRAKTDYPTGADNVKHSDGQHVVDIFVLNSKALMDYMESQGFKVRTNKLGF